MMNNEYSRLDVAVLPEGSATGFERETVTIRVNRETRNIQYGILLELYYLYAWNKLFSQRGNNSGYINLKGKLTKLEKIQKNYKNFLLAWYIYFDYNSNYSETKNGIIEFLKTNFINKQWFDEYAFIGGNDILNYVTKIESQYVSYENKQKILKIIANHMRYGMNRNRNLLNMLLNIIDCLTETRGGEIEEAKLIIVLIFVGMVDEKIRLKESFGYFKNNHSKICMYLKEMILDFQNAIISLCNSGHYIAINDIYCKSFSDIDIYIKKIPKKYKEDYEANGRRCIAIGEDVNSKYVSFSGSEEIESDLKVEFERIVDNVYKVAYLNNNVRCYYGSRRYMTYDKIKSICCATATDNDKTRKNKKLLLKRSCSCCEGKLLNALNTNSNITIYVKYYPCRLCRWGIKHMLKNYRVYYGSVNKKSQECIRDIIEILNRITTKK